MGDALVKDYKRTKQEYFRSSPKETPRKPLDTLRLQFTRELRLGGGVFAEALGVAFVSDGGIFAAALVLDSSGLSGVGGVADARVGR